MTYSRLFPYLDFYHPCDAALISASTVVFIAGNGGDAIVRSRSWAFFRRISLLAMLVMLAMLVLISQLDTLMLELVFRDSQLFTLFFGRQTLPPV